MVITYVISVSYGHSDIMPMTHAPETGTENLVPFFGQSFFVADETGSKISGLIFLYYCPPIHFKAIKQQTTQLI